MKKLIWVAWILLTWPAHGESVVDSLKKQFEQCYPICGAKPDTTTAIIQMDPAASVYSTPARARNWNLFILDSVTLTPHLYKEECEALLGWINAKDLGLHPECFETPKP